MFRPLSLAFAGLALCALTTASHAADEKEIHASACQPHTNSPLDPAAFKVRANGITNGYNTSKYVICPVLKDRDSGWNDSGSASTLNVWFRQQAGGAAPTGNQCTLSIGTESYGPVKSVTKQATPGDEDPGYAVSKFNAADTATSETEYGGAVLVCKLAPGNTLEYIYLSEED